jgi:hypothetical protein
MVIAATVVLQACVESSVATVDRPAKSTPSTSREECLFRAVVDDWTAINDEQLIIYASGRQPYLAKLAFPTPDLKFDYRIGIVDGDGNGRICGYGRDAVVFQDGTIPGGVRILSLQKLERTEAEELIRNARVRGKQKPPAVQSKSPAPAAP